MLALALCALPPFPVCADTPYTIRKGDTLYAIAKRNGVTIADLEKANRIPPGAVLRIGQKIVVPTPSPVPSTTAEPLVVAKLKEISAPPETEGRVPEPVGKPPEASKEPASVPPEAPSEKKEPSAEPAPAPVIAAKPAPSSKAAPAPVPPPSAAATSEPEPRAPRAELVRRAPPAKPAPKPDAPEATPPGISAETLSSRPTPSPKNAPSSRRTAGTSMMDPRNLAADDTRESEVSYLFLGPIRKQLEQIKIQKGRWRYIVVHHSGTKQGNAKIFDRFHRYVRGWEYGLAYHFVIGNGSDSGDGEIEMGERWLRQIHGGHVYSAYLNEISIGICFVGDFNQDRPTPRQAAALVELVHYLRKSCGQPRPRFMLHREINPRPTDCPGNKFPAAPIHKRLD